MSRNSSDRARVGLVLGAGGPVGHAFHSGVLAALWDLGWDARAADVIIGTSAGAQVGALLRAGLSPDDLVHRVCGTPMSPEGREIGRHFVRPDYRQPTYPRRYLPAMPSYLVRNALLPWRWRMGRFFAALLPEGRVCLGPQVEGFRRIFGLRWPPRELWIPAVNLRTGERVAFGRPEAPTTCVGMAVACSGAVPSVVKPLTVGADRFVDGGMACFTHLDLAAQAGIDRLIVSSPLSMFRPFRYRLRLQLRRLVRQGVQVQCIEPSGDALRRMGWNPMDVGRAPAVAELAREAVRHQLAAAPVGGLPGGSR